MFKKISSINKNKIPNDFQLNHQVDSISKDSNNLVIKTDENSKSKHNENSQRHLPLRTLYFHYYYY